MSLGADTLAANGEQFAVPTRASFFPQSFGAQTMGVPNVTPAYPPMMGGPTSVAPGSESVGGYGTSGNNALATQIAHDNPWSFRHSAAPWAIIGLVGGLVLLKAVHWRDVVEGHEALDFGAAHESASAGA